MMTQLYYYIIENGEMDEIWLPLIRVFIDKSQTFDHDIKRS